MIGSCADIAEQLAPLVGWVALRRVYKAHVAALWRDIRISDLAAVILEELFDLPVEGVDVTASPKAL
jgi:hypothetical protein